MTDGRRGCVPTVRPRVERATRLARPSYTEALLPECFAVSNPRLTAGEFPVTPISTTTASHIYVDVREKRFNVRRQHALRDFRESMTETRFRMRGTTGPFSRGEGSGRTGNRPTRPTRPGQANAPGRCYVTTHPATVSDNLPDTAPPHATPACCDSLARRSCTSFDSPRLTAHCDLVSQRLLAPHRQSRADQWSEDGLYLGIGGGDVHLRGAVAVDDGRAACAADLHPGVGHESSGS